MTGSVVVSRNLGNVFSVTVEPPIPLMKLNDLETDFTGAIGYAAGLAAGLSRRLVDMTGAFDQGECEELVARALVRMVVDEVLG